MEREQLLESFSENKKPQPKASNANPLFANPQNAPKQKSSAKKVEKKRIRV